jgi:hypothetical protein
MIAVRDVRMSLFHQVGGHLHLDDAVRSRRRLTTLELVDNIHAGDDFAHYGVLAVEERALVKHDEKLAVGGIRIAGSRHADRSALERDFGKLRRQVRMVRTTGPIPILAVASLRHKAVDDPVERHVIIKAFARQKLQAFGVLRGEVVAQLDDDTAGRGFDDQRVLRIGTRGKLFIHLYSSSIDATFGLTTAQYDVTVRLWPS